MYAIDDVLTTTIPAFPHIRTSSILSQYYDQHDRRRPKHRVGEVNANYRLRTSMACVPRHSPVIEFTMLLYSLWARGCEGGMHCKPLRALDTTRHAHLIFTWPSVPCLTPSTGQPPTPPTTARIRRRGGWRWNDGHFAYGTLPLLDSSPTKHFAYYLDSSPTDCSLFYQQDYRNKIKSDVSHEH